MRSEENHILTASLENTAVQMHLIDNCYPVNCTLEVDVAATRTQSKVLYDPRKKV